MIEKIRENYIFTIRGNEFMHSHEECESIIGGLLPDGKFKDLKYFSDDRNEWCFTKHLTRLVSLCSNKEFAEKNIDLILKGVDFFIDGDYESSNWWHNRIGVPGALGDIGICIEEHLSEHQKSAIIKYLERGSAYTFDHVPGWTGANLAWGVLNTLRHGIFTRNISIVKLAVELIENDFLIHGGSEEGIKPDFGFFQHRTQFYPGGYGRSFIYTAAKLVYTLSGTDLQFERSKLLDLGNFVIHGIAYMIQGHSYDFLTVGREISRDDLGTEVLRKALFLFVNSQDMYAADVMRNLLPSMSFEGYSTVGDKYFENCEYHVSRKKGSHISTKLTAPWTSLGESINGENHLSCNVYAGGNTCIMVDGNEYVGLVSVIDYSRMPGTTAPIQTDEVLATRFSDYHDTVGKNQYCGGLSRDNFGIAFQDLNFGGVTGFISRFFYKGNMVALGSGLTSETGEHIISTVNQCNSYGDYKKFDDGSVFHGRTGYFSLSDVPLESCVKKQSGSFYRNNHSHSDKLVERDVFNAFIDHGTDPENATYSYGVIPLTPSDNTEEFLATERGKIQVLSNTSEIQAIIYENVLFAVFHKAGVLYLPDGRPVRSGARQCVIFEI